MLTQADHLRSSGQGDHSPGPENSQLNNPGLSALGFEAPPPRFALAVVFTVMAGFFAMQVVDILDRGVTPLNIALCLTILPLTIGLQVIQTLPRLRPFRERRGRRVLLAQIVLVVVPCALFGWEWGGMGGFVGASALLLLPTRAGVTVFGLLTGVIALATGVRSGFATVAVPYMTVSTLLTGIIVYSLIRLATLAIAIQEANEDFARLAIAKERLRFARDLHDLLGYSLSAITLKGELAVQLVDQAPERAREELRGIVETSRQALADVREVSRSYRSLSLLNELSSARSVLSAAGVEARVKVDYDRLSGEADTVLATVVREGITNVVRHSAASRCSIEATQQDGIVSLCMVNDAGEPPGEPDGAHRGLGAAADQPDLLHGVDPLDDLLGERDLALTGRTEGGAARDGVVDRCDDLGVGVPEDHGTPGADEVDVLPSVGVGQIRTVAGHHEPGRTAHGAEGTHRGVHATGCDGGRTVEQRLRLGCFVWIWQFAHDQRLLRPSRRPATFSASRAPDARDLIRVGQRVRRPRGPLLTRETVAARCDLRNWDLIHTAQRAPAYV